MPGGMSQMIQMLTTLSDIQSKRRQLDIMDEQMKNSQSQFAQQMGFNEKSEQYKKVSDFIKRIADSSLESRDALVGLASSVGLDENQTKALLQYGAHAPESLEALHTQAANAGYQAASEQQRAQMNAEAASGATTGQSLGGMGMSGLQSAMTGGPVPQGIQGAFGTDFVKQMMRGFAQRSATGQTEFQAAGDQANMGQAGQAAAINYGLKMSPLQLANLGVQQGQLGVAQTNAETSKGQVAADYYRTNASLITAAGELNAKLLTAKRFGGLTPENIIQGVGGLREILAEIQKSNDKSVRTLLLGNYNKLASTIDPNLVWNGQGDPPEPNSVLNKPAQSFFNNFDQPYMGTQPPPQNSTAPFMPQFGGQQFQPNTQFQPSPYAPFINRP